MIGKRTRQLPQRTLQRRLEMMYQNGTSIFQVVFWKRSTGERRVMNCRLGVSKGVTGQQPWRKEQDWANKLITVYEMAGADSGFKCIPLDGLISIGKEPV